MSDRELDAWLAEHLFGYKVCADGPCEHAEPDYRGVRPRRPAHMHQHRDDASFWSNAFPAYSSTGDGMLLVLEALRALGGEVVTLTSYALNVYRATVMLGTVGAEEERTADTLPMAVALAARAALEVEHRAAPVRERGAQ